MTLRVTCPRCSKPLNAPADAAGRTGKCPHCSERIQFPTTAPIDVAPSFEFPNVAIEERPRVVSSLPSSTSLNQLGITRLSLPFGDVLKFALQFFAANLLIVLVIGLVGVALMIVLGVGLAGLMRLGR